ncbi:phosphatidate cytidylyltransferase [Moraxella macacae 0408225]|uniref:Phosphatidate cytidylyltransferase n=1 Tax=Moraxella macacae 0408225 TaxID=1230338 RepID=L2F5C4_9GAMM|nr:phosphatidate cytidylyltransferase [Moraxella macacae]ELA08227.1 phosphatidate cytidylyltransferase [Moraxella macacae 0408225]
MWQRIKTAIVLLIIVGVAMFATQSNVLIIPLLLVMVTVSGYEWAKMLPPLSSLPNQFLYRGRADETALPRQQKHHAMYALCVLTFALISLFLPKIWVIWWGLASVVWLFAINWVANFPNKTKHWYGKRLILVGLIILIATVTAMYSLWQVSAWWLLYVFVLVWCADSGAYFVGRKFGKRKMSPHVSPNKSIEGLIGGVATGVIVVFGVSLGLLSDWSGVAIGLFLLLSLTTIVISVFGDLFESMMKRHAGIKDSGWILPGHGGVLDRIDSQLSAMPVFALGFWLMNYFHLI